MTSSEAGPIPAEMDRDGSSATEARTEPPPREGNEPPLPRLTLIQKVRRLRADILAADVAALLLLLLALVGVVDAVVGVGSALVVGLVVLMSRRKRRPYARPIYPAGTFTVARISLLVAVGVAYVEPSSRLYWVPLVLLGMAVASESTYAGMARFAVPFGVHLPGLSVTNGLRLRPPQAFLVNTAAVAVLVVFAAIGVPSGWWFAVCAVACARSAAGIGDCALVVRGRLTAERHVTQLVQAYAPQFVVHFDAAGGTGYQVGRWLPFLDRVGVRYVVLLRNVASFEEVSAMTDQPVLLRRSVREVDAVMVPSVRAAFYVNNATKNGHLVRYPDVRHIQLNHGDSDKQPSYSAVTRMYDKNFVAGQAAVDRFANHGVVTAPGFFEIVGRPQVEDVQITTGPRPNAAARVLYAPTWAGVYADSAYSSLPVGPAIISALLARGCTVVYRPHPYTSRTPELAVESERIKSMLQADAAAHGRLHVWGDLPENDWSLTDCFNASDVLISDVSSVVPDYLYSEKPFAVCAMTGSLADFLDEMPIAKAGYVILGDASNLDQALEELLVTDPRASLRREAKTYYLGDFHVARYSDAFLDAVRREIG